MFPRPSPPADRVATRPAPRRAPSCIRLALLPLLLLAAPSRAQELADCDIAGKWRMVIKGTFDDTTYLPKGFKGKDMVWVQQVGDAITGLSLGEIKPCGGFTALMDGIRDGVQFSFVQTSPVISLYDCSELGTITLDGTATLLDGVHATLAGGGVVDAGFIVSGLQFSGKLQRVSGMQTPDDPDGDGPAVPLWQMGSGTPGTQGAHDLALTRLLAPKLVKDRTTKPARVKVRAQLQNRSQHVETIADVAALEALVGVLADPVEEAPGTFVITLKAPPAAKFPIALKPGRKLTLRFDAEYVRDLPPEAAPPGPVATFAWSAAVHHAALPGAIADDHPWDDQAPRGIVAPYTFDAYPDGRIRERGVGAKRADKTFGGPVLTGVVPLD